MDNITSILVTPNKQDILTEIVTIRQRMLNRCLKLQVLDSGAISEETIDEKLLDLLEAQLRLANEK